VTRWEKILLPFISRYLDITIVRDALMTLQRSAQGALASLVPGGSRTVGLSVKAERKSMKSCPKMIDRGRRKYLSGAGFAAAGAAAATVGESRNRMSTASIRSHRAMVVF
jgi:hypothetical protein